MSGFEERESASETKFVLDAAKEFKSEARRNKKLAYWLAELMGLETDAVEKYALSVIAADMEEAGDEDVFRKLRKDIDAAGLQISDVELRAKMAKYLDEAREDVYGD